MSIEEGKLIIKAKKEIKELKNRQLFNVDILPIIKLSIILTFYRRDQRGTYEELNV